MSFCWAGKVTESSIVLPSDWIEETYEFEYCLEVCGISYVVATEGTTWSGLKTMYR